MYVLLHSIGTALKGPSIDFHTHACDRELAKTITMTINVAVPLTVTKFMTITTVSMTTTITLFDLFALL